MRDATGRIDDHVGHGGAGDFHVFRYHPGVLDEARLPIYDGLVGVVCGSHRQDQGQCNPC